MNLLRYAPEAFCFFSGSPSIHCADFQRGQLSAQELDRVVAAPRSPVFSFHQVTGHVQYCTSSAYHRYPLRSVYTAVIADACPIRSMRPSPGCVDPQSRRRACPVFRHLFNISSLGPRDCRGKRRAGWQARKGVRRPRNDGLLASSVAST